MLLVNLHHALGTQLSIGPTERLFDSAVLRTLRGVRGVRLLVMYEAK
jgi:hypothetical protein